MPRKDRRAIIDLTATPDNAVPGAYDIAPFVTSWRRNLVARNLSDRTIDGYVLAARALREFLLTYSPADGARRAAPGDLDEIHREHIEAWVTYETKAVSAASADLRLKQMKVFFNWLVEEEELVRAPTERVSPPTVDESAVPVIPADAIQKMLAVTAGTDLEGRRDRALLMLFLDTGLRIGELAPRNLGDLDMDLRVLHIQGAQRLGKSRRGRAVPFGKRTTQALDRYLRTRARHYPRGSSGPDAPLWVTLKGDARLKSGGIRARVERIAELAGVGHIHPHQFRHTFAHLWKVGGGDEESLMRIGGWRSATMMRRYGVSASEERAREAHQHLSPGDRLT